MLPTSANVANVIESPHGYAARGSGPRRQAFERDHREWKITTERMGWVWKAQRDGSEMLIMSNDLRDLLDELERRFAN